MERPVWAWYPGYQAPWVFWAEGTGSEVIEMSELSELVERLKRQRDELALQVHLGSMEAKQE